MESKIRVGVRIRPLNSKELDESSAAAVSSESDKFVVTKGPIKKTCLEYDWSFDPAATNRIVYEQSCRPLIENIFEGFNATFFAYGQTSSGKTHTLGGSDMSEGVIPSALQDIFQRSAELRANGTKVDIEVSYIEIYREECFDLLSKEQQKIKLDLKETSNGKTVLDGVTSHAVQDIDAVMTHLRNGAKIRSTGQTAMNAHSSRSHSICTLNLRVVRATTGAVTSQLHLVDLAGSERAKKTQATGDAFQEGISINRGLLALGNVVSALASRSLRTATGSDASSHIHVPYRESKLTRLLKDSLGGNGMTVMLACVSPAECNLEETLNTLRFASRASSIVNSARVNHSVGDSADTAALLKEVLQLREQVSSLQAMQSSAGTRAANTAVFMRNLEAEQAQRASYHFMVSSALRVTVSLKSVLVTCLQEGSYVVDTDLLHIQSELQEIRKGLNLPASTVKAITPAPASADGAADGTASDPAGELCDLEFEAMLQLPPIMTVIEEVRLLERDLRAVERSSRVAARGGAAAGKGAHTVPQGADESMDFGNESIISGGSLDISTSGDFLDSGSGPTSLSDAQGGRNSCNASFDQSFDGLTEDGDGFQQRMAAFDVDCSFNEMDAAGMGDILAEYIASQQQQEGLSSSSAAPRSAPGMLGRAPVGGKAVGSSVEEELARQAAQGLAAKEAEVTRVAALTDKYQSSIKTLKAEIAALESDQGKLQARQQQVQQVKKPLAPANKFPTAGASSGTSAAATAVQSSAASAEELRIKQQLKEKTRLLEEKVKLLRSKESEFGKVSSQKVRLMTEVETMKKVVEENKRKRADLQRKMREEATVHRNEKVQIKHSEIQARRGELQAQQSVVRLEGQLQSREKVHRAQLESKEREAKALKELVQKQATVKSMQAGRAVLGHSSAVSAHTLAAAGALLTQQGSSGLSTQDALNLKLWVDQELDAQVKRAQTQEALTKEMFLRTKAAQQLQAIRRSSHGSSAAATDAPAADAKALENELRARSATIAGLNGVLSDLGNASTADKKRFARFTDLKESRHVSEVLFEVAAKAQKREHTASRRMRSLQDALHKCKQQLKEAQTSATYYQQLATQRAENYIFDDEESEHAEMDETFYPSEEESAYASDGSDSDDSYVRAGRRKGRAAGKGADKKRKADSANSSVDIEADALEGAVKPKKVRIQAQPKRSAASIKRTAAAASSEDQEGGDASGSDGAGSESDHASSSDGGSDSETERAPAKKRPAKAAAGAAEGKKAKRAAGVDPDFDDAEITLPLTKHTISELKRFLAAKGLPVSGVKAELIKRLQAVLPSQDAPINDENNSAAENAAVDAPAEHSEPLLELTVI